MIVPIPYAGNLTADFHMKEYVKYLIRTDNYELHQRQMDSWQRWYYSMEVE
jgi:hypothetical protein